MPKKMTVEDPGAVQRRVEEEKIEEDGKPKEVFNSGERARPDERINVKRVAELGDRVLDFFERNSKPHEAALVTRLLADMLEGVYGVPVDQKTYVQIARGFKIAAAKRYGLKYQEESGEPGVMYA